MERFLLLVYAGLTGSVTMISCTVLALTRLFFEFKGERGRGVGHGGAGRRAGHGLSPAALADHMGLSVVEQLLQNVCLLLGSRTRDVVKAALGFLKVVLLLVDTKLLAKHVQTMVRAQRGVVQLELPCPWCLGDVRGVPSCALLLPGSRGAQPWSRWQREGSSPKYWRGFARDPPRTKQGDLPAALPAAQAGAGRWQEGAGGGREAGGL